jgi:nitrous oxidase accessory protein
MNRKRFYIYSFISCLLLGFAVVVIPFSAQDSLLVAKSSAAASGSAETVAGEFQQLVDKALPGDTITLQEGIYTGPVTINKPLTITGTKTAVLLNNSKDPAILIDADKVVLRGFTIQHNQAGNSEAVGVNSDEVVLDQLNIETRGFGIRLRNSDRGMIHHNIIIWSGAGTNEKLSMGKKENGIDLYNSHDNRIEYNAISHMRDGIYLENSHRTKVDKNQIYHSRYGVHCMYTNETQITDNVGEYNVTGAMIMGVADVLVSHNSFRKQSENVNSQGILLFDVQTSLIEHNVVEGNRVGIYMELSSNNQLRDNDVWRNFMGIQILESEGNQFNNNRFIANVIEAEALDSSGNLMNGNYWDAFQGLDLDHDGTSNIAYNINPFYQQLIQNTPAFQLFFQSPGMTFLSNMFADNKEGWSADASPLMAPTSSGIINLDNMEGKGVGIASLLLLLAAIFTITYLGVKRT